ncbi:MAG: hypothetical protein NTY55_01150 [Flavobacteriia bacterium]|nr:hypothetical protein [Flavobacteriia bacterium]
MKKIIISIVLLASFISNAQIHNASGNIKTKSAIEFTDEDYIGFWSSEGTSHIVIWKDCNNNMQIAEFSATSGVPLEIVSLNFNKTNLFVKTNFKETNFTSESEFVFVDKSTLICTVSGDGNAPLTYKKVR